MKRKPIATKADTSHDVDSLSAELRYAGDRESIEQMCVTILDHLRSLKLPASYLGYIEIGRSAKRNFAQRLSTAVAQKIADALRSRFKGINPDESGHRHESKTMGAGGPKKIDVNYMTPEMGLGLAVSVKTINFRDEKSRRYTKNIKRADGELRAEAQDCHLRQPFSVLAGIVLLPKDSADDGIDGRSSLKHAWDVFRHRGGRVSHTDNPSHFELMFIGLYDTSAGNFGNSDLFEVAVEPPDRGAPKSVIKFSQALDLISTTFRSRNKL
jgi:hypothetical protein